jgi:pimeloyl-ACP methyl ester carboxylesterase
LTGIKTDYNKFYVDLGHCIGPQTDKIWTLSMNTESPNTPLLMIHGFGAGIGFWVLNYDALAANRPVYAIDLPGYGKSSRSKFSKDAKEIEAQFCNAIERWRQLMKIEKMILLGHSFGGYISLAYSMQFPERVENLVLADPWGFVGLPQDLRKYSLLKRSRMYLTSKISPLFIVRAAGPAMGPLLFRKLRTDIVEKFENVIENHDKTIAKYVYHCNSQKITGELAFKHLLEIGHWPKYPMCDRLDQLCDKIPMTVIFGENSWLDNSYGPRLKEIRPASSYTRVEYIESAGHQLFSDNASEFNRIVNEACEVLKDR